VAGTSWVEQTKYRWAIVISQQGI